MAWTRYFKYSFAILDCLSHRSRRAKRRWKRSKYSAGYCRRCPKYQSNDQFCQQARFNPKSLVSTGQIGRKSWPWLDAWMEKPPMQIDAISYLNMACDKSKPGVLSSCGIGHVKESLLLDPSNGPYLKRVGDCVIAIGFKASLTGAWAMIQTVVAALLEQCLGSSVARRVGGMSISTLGMNGKQAKTNRTRRGRIDTGYFKSSHGFFSIPISSLPPPYKAQKTQTQLRSRDSRTGKDNTSKRNFPARLEIAIYEEKDELAFLKNFTSTCAWGIISSHRGDIAQCPAPTKRPSSFVHRKHSWRLFRSLVFHGPIDVFPWTYRRIPICVQLEINPDAL